MKMQCAAQILWGIEGDKIPTKKAMMNRLCDDKSPLAVFLKADLFASRRTIPKWILHVFPGSMFDDIIPIPNTTNGEVVSFPRVRFAVYCTTSILKAFGWDIVQVCKSKFIKTLVPAKEPIFGALIRCWSEDFYDRNVALEGSKFGCS